MSHRAAPALLVLGALVFPGSAQAQPAQGATRGEVARVAATPVEWDPAWPKFHTGEWIAGGVGIAALLASRVLPLPNAHWRGGFGIDEPARDLLRFHTPSARRWARDGSDIGIAINASWPFFDALVIAGWYRNSPEVGVQQALISAEVLTVTAGVQGLVSFLASRERPYGRECGAELPENTRDCLTRDRYYSFYSGHSAHSFAAAAVNCMHHAYVPLYGGGAAEDWACAGGFGIAVTTALLRVGTDVHYVSDVAMGALIGTTTGLMLPWALHYGHAGAQMSWATEDLQLTVLPSLSPDFTGLHGVLVF